MQIVYGAILAVVTGSLIFLIRERIKKGNLRRESSELLLAKIIYWNFRAYNDSREFRGIWKGGNAVYLKFGNSSSLANADEEFQKIQKDIDSRTSRVFKELKKQNTLEDLTNELLDMKEWQIQSAFEYLNKLHDRLTDGTMLISKDLVKNLSLTQKLSFYELNDRIDSLIESTKTIFNKLKHQTPEEFKQTFEQDLKGIFSDGIWTTKTMWELIRKLKK